MAKKTDWGNVADWYDDLLETGGNYQRDVILPDLLSILSIKKGDRVLDLACGQGFFSREFKRAGAMVIAVDASHELVDIAKGYEKSSLIQSADKTGGDIGEISYFMAPSHKLDFIKDGSIDKIAIVLALQNIDRVVDTFAECGRVVKNGGSLVIVLNHPAFRIPKGSAWGFDEKNGVQYRRMDRYMSEFKVAINMHPGGDRPVLTSSFHRPLQYYFKNLKSAGFLVRTMHELISNKISQPGPRAEAENLARKEFPLFMTIESVKE